MTNFLIIPGREILEQPVSEIEDEKLQQVVREFPAPFALVPWRHHVEVISKCKSVEKAMFYLNTPLKAA